MSETRLMAEVRDRAGAHGLLTFHSYDSRRDWGPGFPDLVIAGPGGVRFIECKDMRGSLSDDQREWWAVLSAARVPWSLWRPVHLARGEIDAELAALGRPS